MLLNYRTTPDTYIKDYLYVMNCFFELSKTELRILNEFLKLYFQEKRNGRAESTCWQRTFDASSKKYVAGALGYFLADRFPNHIIGKKKPNPVNIIDQYIFALKKKKVLIKTKDYLKITSILVPTYEPITFDFKIEKAAVITSIDDKFYINAK